MGWVGVQLETLPLWWVIQTSLECRTKRWQRSVLHIDEAQGVTEVCVCAGGEWAGEAHPVGGDAGAARGDRGQPQGRQHEGRALRSHGPGCFIRRRQQGTLSLLNAYTPTLAQQAVLKP